MIESTFEDQEFWCIVCRQFVRFGSVSKIRSSRAAGGWYCGRHSQDELDAAKSGRVRDRNGMPFEEMETR